MSPIFKATLLAATAAFAVLGIAGCSSNEPQTPPTVVNTTPPPAAPVVTTTPVATTPGTPGVAPATKVNVNAGPGGSQGVDSPTAEAINKAIVTNKQMTGSRVEVVVDAAGVATLTGTTQNQQQKALAARAATNTPGVTDVKNKIEIVATGGAKSATKPPVTKVIVVHEQAPAPKTSPADTPSPSAAPATDSSSGANANSSGTNSTDTSGSTDPTAAPTAPKTNDGGQ